MVLARSYLYDIIYNNGASQGTKFRNMY